MLVLCQGTTYILNRPYWIQYIEFSIHNNSLLIIIIYFNWCKFSIPSSYSKLICPLDVYLSHFVCCPNFTNRWRCCWSSQEVILPSFGCFFYITQTCIAYVKCKTAEPLRQASVISCMLHSPFLLDTRITGYPWVDTRYMRFAALFILLLLCHGQN